jgi:hypothetical protein
MVPMLYQIGGDQDHSPLYSQGKRTRDRRCIEEAPISNTFTCLQLVEQQILRGLCRKRCSIHDL